MNDYIQTTIMEARDIDILVLIQDYTAFLQNTVCQLSKNILATALIQAKKEAERRGLKYE